VRRQKDFDAGKKVSIGVNKFRTEEKIPGGAFKIDPKVEQIQIERLGKLKARRDNHAVQRALDAVRAAAGSSDNLVPPVSEAVRRYATVGEISGVLRKLYGEYQAREYFGAGR
jgi:methylmalonyl-CoA mutase N-terminal domain/subunit